MCGILGTVNFPFFEDTLDSLAHRGPDGCGIVDFRLGGHHLTLGHRRLAIVDLTVAGQQPMRTPCGTYSLVYNGELYNHLDLRKKIPDVSFRGHSDTETILYSIATHGVEAIQAFNGIFALAFVDAKKGRLFLMRDPFGVKPLYYYHRDQCFIFSSEIKPILKMVEDTVDPTNLAEVLRLRYTPSPDTLFRNIKKVRPGHIVEVNLLAAELSCREYSIPRSVLDTNDLSFQEAVNQYGHLFEQAVQRQLMSDVDVGVFLSGGIDSALVASYAQMHSTYRMKSFTMGFLDPSDVDEVSEAKETASTVGMDCYETRINFEDFLQTLPTCVSIVEEPLATTSVIPMFYLSKLASQQVKVVLSGQGADESLGGYGRYQGELYKNFVPPALARLLNPIARLLGVKNEQVLRGLQSMTNKSDLARFLSAYSVFDQNQIQELTGIQEQKSAERLDYFFKLLHCNEQQTSVERMMSLDLRTNLADDLLLYTDKITMHHSLECRVPMLDLDLVYFIESLRYNFRVQMGKSKIIHKAFAQKSLPLPIIHRKKKGFLSPTETWFRKGNLLRDILLAPSTRFSTFFNLGTVEGILREHENGLNRERQIFLLLNLYYWIEEFT